MRRGGFRQGDQSDRVASPAVQQHGGGIAEEVFGALLFRFADEAGCRTGAVVGDVVRVECDGPLSASIRAGEGEYIVKGGGESLGENSGLGEMGVEGLSCGFVAKRGSSVRRRRRGYGRCWP